MDLCIDNGDIEGEIQWGLNYRQEKNKVRTVALVPKKSPINLQGLWQRYQITKQINELELIKRQVCLKPVPKSLKLSKVNQLNKLDRAGFTKKQYINYLATPHHYIVKSEPSPIVALRKKIKPEKCSARLVELSRPTKNRVYNTWHDYWHCLPAEVIERLDALLRTDRTLDPAYARCCFKDLDRRRRKEKRKRQQMHKKKKRRLGDDKWLEVQIDLTADLMVSFFEQDPLVTLSYKQTLISDVIMDLMVKHRHLNKKPMRNSSNLHQRSIVDVIDQLSVWMDSIARYVDVQYVDSREDVRARKSIESVDEGESGEGDSGRFELPPLPPLPSFQEYPDTDDDKEKRRKMGQEEVGEGEGEGEDGDVTAFSIRGKMLDTEDETDKYKTEDEETELEKGSKTESKDLMPVLLDILQQSGVDFENPIDEANLPGVTYKEIYEKIEDLRNDERKAKQEIVGKAIVDWAKASDPDKVDDKMIKKIHSAAELISEHLSRDQSVRDDTSKIDSVTAQEDKTLLSNMGEESEFNAAKILPLYSKAEDELDTDYDAFSSDYGETEQVSGKMFEDESVSAIEEVKPETVDKETSSIDQKPSLVSEKIPPTEILPATESKQVEEIMGAKTDIGLIIPKHKPSKVFEHAPDTICCLTLKVWAVWLLEVASNAQSWSKWLNDIISEIRTTARILRGEVLDSNGRPVLLYKEDWREFVEKVERMIVSWRQYSMHVKDLTDKIIQNFHGKKITCCPKCLEDNLIVNIAAAHDISQQLAEAMNTASYWRRWLDSVVMETNRLTSPSLTQTESSTSSYGTYELVEIQLPRRNVSEESLYEIEELP